MSRRSRLARDTQIAATSVAAIGISHHTIAFTTPKGNRRLAQTGSTRASRKILLSAQYVRVMPGSPRKPPALALDLYVVPRPSRRERRQQ